MTERTRRCGLANSNSRPRLVEVCPAFAAKVRHFNEVAPSDPAKAAGIFAEAQAIGQAFWQGVEYACGVEQ